MSFLRMISTPETYDAAKAYFEEVAFQRRASQGELACPMIISDTQPALASQTNGRVYDSKSEMRKEYRRAGVEEVGNEKMQRKAKTADERKQHREQIKGALYRAHSQMGFGAP